MYDRVSTIFRDTRIINKVHPISMPSLIALKANQLCVHANLSLFWSPFLTTIIFFADIVCLFAYIIITILANDVCLATRYAFVSIFSDLHVKFS